MSNKERIAENNNQLRECIALAGAGGGSGDSGGSGVGEYINMECYYRFSALADDYYTLAQLFMGAGYSPVITYYVVDALPESPNVTNMATANPAHVYIYNNVPYVYGNAGYGDMWMGVVDVLAVLGDITTTAKGFTYYIEGETEEGVYVTYDQISQEGIDNLRDALKVANTERANTASMMESIVSQNVQSYDLSNFDIISVAGFAYNRAAREVILPTKATWIYPYAFFGCENLQSVNVQKVAAIHEKAFFDCPNLTTITYNGTKEEWKASIGGIMWWNNNTGDLTIYCTDGTIARDGTES